MGKDKSEKTSYQLKVPKGTKDWEGRDMVIRDKIFGSITEVFKRHGAVTIDTSVKYIRPVKTQPMLTRLPAQSLNSRTYWQESMEKTANSSMISRTRAARSALCGMT